MRRGGCTLTRRLFVAISVLLVGSFGFFGVLAFSATDAHAACPPPTGARYIGGTCFTVKGVQVNAQVNHTGNLNQKPKTFDAVIDVTGSFGIVFCGNNGGNQPPGQVFAPIQQATQLTCDGGPVPILPQNVVSNQNGGTANVVCTARLVGAALAAYDEFCTPGQFALDFVPITFEAGVKYDDATGEIEHSIFECELPNPGTLKWNRTTNLPEPRPYNCTLQE
jgi:hypothetical protein